MLLSYSDRGGEGGEDIFVSRRIDGQWSKPANLGPGINSRDSDFAPKLSPDGTFIVFSSDRAYNDRVGAPTLQPWWVSTAELIEDGVLSTDDLTR